MVNDKDKVEVERRFVKNIFFNSYAIIVPAKSEVFLDQEGNRDHILQTHDLKLIRGHFLDLIIEIESLTDVLIENGILHKKSRLWKVFRKNITNNRNMTFKPKIELLCEVIIEREELKEDEVKILKKHLETLRDERNRWAHGTIRFRQHKKEGKLKLQPSLIYVNSKGEENEIPLIDSYFDELTHKFQKIQELLNKVMVRRGLLPKDYLKKKVPQATSEQKTKESP